MLLVPHTLASELPFTVGQATRSHAVYRYKHTNCVRTNIHEASIVAMP